MHHFEIFQVIPGLGTKFKVSAAAAVAAAKTSSRRQR